MRETHLGDPVVPAHPPEPSGRQDDGGKVLLLVQLLQTCVEVPTLGMSAQENTRREKNLQRRFDRQEKKKNRVSGYDVFKIQMWEPLLQLSGPTQRAGADHAADTEVGVTQSQTAQRTALTVPVGWQSVQSFPNILWVEHHGIVGVFSPEE